MSLVPFVIFGFLFVVSFALSLRGSVRGFPLFLCILTSAVAAIFILLNILSILEQLDLRAILIILILAVIAVLVLAKMRFRIY